MTAKSRRLVLGSLVSALACVGVFYFLEWRRAEFAKDLARWEKLEAYARTADLRKVVDQEGAFFHGIDRGFPLAEYSEAVDDRIDYVEIHATDGEVWYQMIGGKRWFFAVFDEAHPMSSDLLKDFTGEDEMFHTPIYRKPGFVVFRRGFRD